MLTVTDVHEPDVDRALRFVTALLDFTLYSSLPYASWIFRPVDSHRTIVYAYGSSHIVTLTGRLPSCYLRSKDDISPESCNTFWRYVCNI
jgi:hypothetical protein